MIQTASGEWRFEDGRLRSGSREVEVPTIDFFERWTFARFLDEDVLALAFESSQPWSEGGSYGDRYGGVEIMALHGDDWRPVAIEFDYRAHDENFVPIDVAWHRRGFLAWLRDGFLYVQLLQQPRRELQWELVPVSDSRQGTARTFELSTKATELLPLEAGRWLIARGPDEALVFDLDQSAVAYLQAPLVFPVQLEKLKFEPIT